MQPCRSGPFIPVLTSHLTILQLLLAHFVSPKNNKNYRKKKFSQHSCSKLGHDPNAKKEHIRIWEGKTRNCRYLLKIHKNDLQTFGSNSTPILNLHRMSHSHPNEAEKKLSNKDLKYVKKPKPNQSTSLKDDDATNAIATKRKQ